MSIKVQLPPGCKGFDCKDGTKYTAARAGGHVMVDDRHADAIQKSQFGGDAHLVGNVGRTTFGTKKGMRCTDRCRRIWNAWNDVCPKCGTPTEPIFD